MTVHLVDENGVPLCPEAEQRDRMDDATFWEHVLQPGEHADYEPDEDALAERDDEHRLATPCPECGQVGACAYDPEGRALIHVTESED